MRSGLSVSGSIIEFGSASFRVSGSQVTVEVDELRNTSNRGTGTLYLSLRFTQCESPLSYGHPAFTTSDNNYPGLYSLNRIVLGSDSRLGPGDGWASIQFTTGFQAPRDGTYLPHLVVYEFDPSRPHNGATTQIGHLTFDGTRTIGGGGHADDSCFTAPRQSVNGNRAAAISPAYDADYYRLDVPSRGTLLVDTTGASDTVEALLDPTGVPLEENDDGGVSDNFRIDRTVGAGLLFVRVSGYEDETGSYTLRVRHTPDAPPTRADLVVESPRASAANLKPGQSFTLSARVRNRGNGPASATRLRYYRSADQTISSSDSQVGTSAVSRLATGASSDESLALSASAAPGTYYYGACVDPVEGESQRGNNCSSAVRIVVRDDDGSGESDDLVPVSQLGDFNGDGNDDVLLRHRDGRWLYYPMDGRNRMSGGGWVDLPQDRDWRLVGIGDFGGDGKDDVLLRHEDGRWRYQPMDGRSLLEGGGELSFTPDVNWRVAGIGDLNGDGRDDVLLRHRNGRWHYYPLNGRRRAPGGGPVADLPSGVDWRFAGLGDLNGDGRDDVLLRRHRDGRWLYYPMDGRNRMAGGGWVDLPQDRDWRLVGVGDFGGDGQDDVLLRHEDGRWRYQPMDGRSLLEGGGELSFTRNVNWRVAGIGDLNGDGRDDVLLRHRNGSWHYYPLNGRRRASGGGTVDDLPSGVNWLLAWETYQPRPGAIGGRVTVTQGQVLDGDTNDPRDPSVDNGSVPQPVPVPASVAGFADHESDEWDIYLVDLPAPMRISLAIAEPEVGDLDLYLVNRNREITGESAGLGDLEVVQTRRTGEHLVAVRAYEGASNYSLVLSFIQSASGAAAGAADSSDGEFVVGELIVKFKDEGGGAAQTVATVNYPQLVEKAKAPSGAVLMGVRPSARLRIVSKSLGGTGFRYATEALRAKAETLRQLKRLRKDPAVEYVQPNYIYQAMAVPNDPYYVHQWHYPLIALPQAWDITKGNDDVVMALIDSGVVTDHPDLASRLLRNGRNRVVGYDFIADRNRAADGDGIDPDPYDVGDSAVIGKGSSFHGTHVAGTVGAATDNGNGVAGVTWSGKIMPIRVLGKGGGTSWDIAQGIRYAARLANDSGDLPPVRADVVNLSLGPSNEQCRRLPAIDRETRDALGAAIDAGVVVVVAAGNDSCGESTPMSTVEGVISVSATDQIGRAPYSNYGAMVDVAAPGGSMVADQNGDGYPDGVLSTLADDSAAPLRHEYDFLQGTSMAAPHVSGVVALMLAVNPDLTPNDINRLLAGTHADPAAGPITRDWGAPGRDDEFGHGLIDANQAVRVARAIRGGNNNPPARPVLAISPTRLNFGATADVLRVQLSNAGSGEVRVSAVESDARWLSVSYEEWPTLVLRVSRAGLADRTYVGHVRLRSNGGNLTVPVVMQVQRRIVEADVGTVYVLALDPDTYKPLSQHRTNVRRGYAFKTPKLPGGDYLVAAGTDRDDDGYICDPGEACGIWPLLDSPGELAVDGDQRVEFGVSIDLFARIASQSVESEKVPRQGFAIPPVEPATTASQ